MPVYVGNIAYRRERKKPFPLLGLFGGVSPKLKKLLKSVGTSSPAGVEQPLYGDDRTGVSVSDDMNTGTVSSEGQPLTRREGSEERVCRPTGPDCLWWFRYESEGG